MECLKNIIGLSRTECECLTDQLPTGSDEISDYNESASGVYLDELPGFNINVSSGADDCAKGGLWERLYRARENAISDYKTNLLACVNKKYKQRIDNFSGLIGQVKYKGTNNYSENYAGMRIYPEQIKGGFMYVKQIGILVNAAVPVTVKIFSNKDGYTEIFSGDPINGDPTGVVFAELEEALELPMWDDSGLSIKYFALLVLDGTFQPRKNKDCGCGSSANRKPYVNWMTISGAKGNDLNDIDSFSGSTDNMNGIVLDIDVKCKSSEIICSSQYPLDFDNDPDAMGMALAIRFRSAAILYQDLLGSDLINRFTMMNREDIGRYINEWNDKFIEWVNYECENMSNMNENDCWVCKEGKNDIIKRFIKVT